MGLVNGITHHAQETPAMTTTAPAGPSTPDSDAAWHPSVLSPDEVLARMGADAEQGLSPAEAASRLERHGPNELTGAPPVPAWRRFLAQFADPLVYLLLAAVGISVAAWVLEGAAGVPIEAVVIVAILLANAIIGFVQENRADDAVAALSTMTAATSTVLRGGRLDTIPSAEVVPGDILVLAEGDAVAADARLIQASALRIQESSLTGESEAVDKTPEALDAPAGIGDRHDMVHKGTDVVSGVGRAVVTATGMATEVGRIATLLDETPEEDTPLQREIASISKALGLVVIAIAVIVMGVMVLVNGVRSFHELVDVLLTGVSLAVAAVPEGLPAILTVVLATGVRALARRNAVMKTLHSVETLGSSSVICSDKTGTLTRNEMTLRTVVSAAGRAELTGTGYAPDGELVVTGDRDAVRAVLVGGALANDAQLHHDDGEWTIQGDPTEAAFLVACAKSGLDVELAGWRRRSEVPFSSERKMMSVLVERDGQRRVWSKGAPDVLLGRCTDERVGGVVQPLTETRRAELLGLIEDLSANGYRTLGVAARPGDGIDELTEDDEHRLAWTGVVGIIDPPRKEAAEAIGQAHRAGIRTIMITGDHPVTASRIAADLGISGDREPRALTGAQLDGLGPGRLPGAVRDVDVYARVAPEHKLRIVEALQSDGSTVAMTGDGVNDAPALKRADIGVAMGITGTEVTKQAGRMILADDNYATIVAAVRQGRVIVDNIKKFLRYLLSSNMGEVCTVLFGVLLAGALGLSDPANPGATFVPLLVTQILWINLVTDSTPALAMGVDPEIDDVMARPPRRQTDRILDRAMWIRIIAVGAVMGLVTLAVYDFALPGGLFTGMLSDVPTGEQFAVARTMAFSTLVFAQLFNALNSRSADGSAFHRLFSNRWLWASLGLGVVLQVAVVEIGFLQSAFGTTSLDLAHWGVVVAASSLILVYEEIVKAVHRAVARARGKRR